MNISQVKANGHGFQKTADLSEQLPSSAYAICGDPSKLGSLEDKNYLCLVEHMDRHMVF